MVRKEKYYDPKKRRLLFVFKEATPEFWDAVWDIDQGSVERAFYLSETLHVRMVKKYLKPQDGLILEGGCGDGRKAAALVESGYHCIGVDFAPKTVEMLRRYMPELDVRLGNVMNLPFGSDHFSGYLSVGVIEHPWGGYEMIFKEMRRVIKPSGYLFLSFPYMSPIRKLKARLGLYRIYDGHKPDNFYQFALNHNDVMSDLLRFGFRLISKVAYNPYQGFGEEVPAFGSVTKPRKSSLFARILRKAMVLPLSPLICHSIFLVLKKRER